MVDSIESPHGDQMPRMADTTPTTRATDTMTGLMIGSWYWFSDQVQGPVEIKGTVSAKRANAYDYVAEWAPGVQPLDARSGAPAPWSGVAESATQPVAAQ